MGCSDIFLREHVQVKPRHQIVGQPRHTAL